MEDYNELALRCAKADRENAKLREMLDRQIVANAALTGENAELFCKLAAAQKDAERIEFLAEKAKTRSGVSIDFCKFVEDGYVVEKSYRVMWFHNLGERAGTIRGAIDAAMTNEKAE